VTSRSSSYHLQGGGRTPFIAASRTSRVRPSQQQSSPKQDGTVSSEAPAYEGLFVLKGEESMPQEGKIWPTTTDQQPLSAIFHVPRSSLVGDEQYVSGTTRIHITEEPQQVEARLRQQFPVYRIVKWGGQLIKRSGMHHEV
jgi:hypothetical protein